MTAVIVHLALIAAILVVGVTLGAVPAIVLALGIAVLKGRAAIRGPSLRANQADSVSYGDAGGDGGDGGE